MNLIFLTNISFLKILFILLFFLDLIRIIFNINAFYLYFSLLLISSIIIIKNNKSIFVFFKKFKYASLIIIIIIFYNLISVSWSSQNQLVKISTLFFNIFPLLLAASLVCYIKISDIRFFSKFSKLIIVITLFHILVEMIFPNLSFRILFPHEFLLNAHGFHSFNDDIILYYSSYFISSDKMADIILLAYLFIVFEYSFLENSNSKLILVWTSLLLLIIILSGRRSQMIIGISFLLFTFIYYFFYEIKYSILLIFLPLIFPFAILYFDNFSLNSFPNLFFLVDGVLSYTEERLFNLFLPSLSDSILSGGLWGNGIGINSQLIDSNEMSLNIRFESGLSAIISEFGIIGFFLSSFLFISIIINLILVFHKKHNFLFFFIFPIFIILTIFRLFTQYTFFINPYFQFLLWILLACIYHFRIQKYLYCEKN